MYVKCQMNDDFRNN